MAINSKFKVNNALVGTGGGVNTPPNRLLLLTVIYQDSGIPIAALQRKQAAHPIQMLSPFEMCLFQLLLPLRGI